MLSGIRERITDSDGRVLQYPSVSPTSEAGQPPNRLTKRNCPVYKEFPNSAKLDSEGRVTGDGCQENRPACAERTGPRQSPAQAAEASEVQPETGGVRSECRPRVRQRESFGLSREGEVVVTEFRDELRLWWSETRSASGRKPSPGARAPAGTTAPPAGQPVVVKKH